MNTQARVETGVLEGGEKPLGTDVRGMPHRASRPQNLLARALIQPGLRVRTQVSAGASSSQSSCNTCKKNCKAHTDYYDCISQCDLVCS